MESDKLDQEYKKRTLKVLQEKSTKKDNQFINSTQINFSKLSDFNVKPHYFSSIVIDKTKNCDQQCKETLLLVDDSDFNL